VVGAYLASAGVAGGAGGAIEMLMERFPAGRRRGRLRELWRPFEELIRGFEVKV
jgi:hypothetical protein